MFISFFSILLKLSRNNFWPVRYIFLAFSNAQHHKYILFISKTRRKSKGNNEWVTGMHSYSNNEIRVKVTTVVK